MRLRIKFYQLAVLLLTPIIFSMCSMDEGVKPSNDQVLTSRGLLTGSPSNASLIGLSTTNELVMLSAGPPVVETSVIPITGLRDGENIVAIDMRTKTSELYGLSTQSTIYKINPGTGVATAVGAPFTPEINGTIYGFDINPADDVIRLMTDKLQNLRISTTTGQVTAVDPYVNLNNLSINGIAYLPIVSGGKAVLYDLDVSTGSLYKQTNANGGPFTYVGNTGFNWSTEGGFDISSAPLGYAVQFGSAKQGSPGWGSDDTTQEAYRLYTINLKTGRATSMGKVRPMLGVAVR